MNFLKKLFTPTLDNANPDKRLQALEALAASEQATFAKVLTQEADETVRRAALKRISDIQLLGNALSLLNGDLRKAAEKQYNKLLLNAVSEEPENANHVPLVASMTDENTAAEVFQLQSSHPTLREKALEQIKSESLLARLAESNCGTLGEAIVERLTEEPLLERLSKKGGNKNVRNKATEKLETFFKNSPVMEKVAADEAPESDHANSISNAANKADVSQTLDAIVLKASQYALSWQWEYAASRLDELKAEFERKLLDAGEEDSERRQKLEVCLKQFQERREAFKQQQAAEAEAAKQREEKSLELAALLDQIEELIEPPSEAGLEQIEQLLTQWPDTAEIGHRDFDALTDRYNLLSEKIQTVRQFLDTDRKLFGRLQRLCEEAEKLADATSASRRLETCAKLKKDFGEPELHVLDASDLVERFRTACQKIEDAENEARELAEKANRELIERATKVREDLEAVLENQGCRKVDTELKRLKAELDDIGKTSKNSEVREILADCRECFQKAKAHQSELHEEEKWKRWANLNLKKELCAKAEKLDQETDMISLSSQLKDLQAEWKKVGPGPGKEEQEVWEQFHAICERNFQRTQEFFQELDKEREASKTRKETLCEEAEALKDSEDWKATSEKLKQLQADWKALPRLKPQEEKEIRQRFSDACDRFFNRLREHSAEVEKERHENTQIKDALCKRAEEIAAEPSWNLHADLKKVQQDWRATGPVTQDQAQTLNERFHKALQTFYTWLDEQRPQNQEKKEALLAKLKKLLEDLPEDAWDKETAEQVKAIQKEWKEIGPGTEKDDKAIWQEFQQLCNQFFAQRRSQFNERQKLREENLGTKQELVEKAESLSESTDWRGTAELMQELKDAWQKAGRAPRDEEKELGRRFFQAIDQFFERRREFFTEKAAEREQNLIRKEALCQQLEKLVGLTSDAQSEQAADTDKSGGVDVNAEQRAKPSNNVDLAKELELALTTNTMVKLATSGGSNLGDKVRQIQRDWKHIGRVPEKNVKDLEARFKAALDKYYNERKRNQ